MIRYSKQAEWIVFKLFRKKHIGKRVIQEGNITARPGLLPPLKPALRELEEAGILKKKKGKGMFTYSLNPAKMNEIYEIYDRVSREYWF